MKRAVIYTRVSTGKQAESGLGLADQKQALVAAVEAKGWVLTYHARDAGASAKSLHKRPGLDEALAMLDSGKADVLIASKLDRLSRSVADFAALVDRAKSRGWALVVLDVEVDTTTPAGEFLVNVLSSAAQYERRLIAERTKAAHRVRKAQGKRAGQAPLLPQAVRARIRTMRDDGLSLRAIAAVLNDEGVPTARGGTWAVGTIQHVLSSLAVDDALAGASP